MSNYVFYLGDEGVTTFDCGHKAKRITGEIHDYRGPMVYYIILLHADGRVARITILSNHDVFQNFKDCAIVVVHVEHTSDGKRKYFIIDPENRGNKGDRYIFGRDEFKSLFSDSDKKYFWEIVEGILHNDPGINRGPVKRGSRKPSCRRCGGRALS